MKKKPAAPKRFVRVKVRNVYPVGMPGSAKVLISQLRSLCSGKNLMHACFAVDAHPPSVNHQYVRGKGSNPYGNRLSPKAKAFREQVYYQMGRVRKTWKPTGVTAAIIIFENPLWITKERAVRQKDADNSVKPLFDAIEEATGAPDEMHWEFHVYKVLAKKVRTTVYLFDLGDVVDYFG